jgi:AraC family transcriptional regulator
MTIRSQPLRATDRTDIEQSPDAIAITVGNGRIRTATFASDHVVCVALRGEVQLDVGDGPFRLQPGQMLTWSHGPMKLSGRQPGVWVAIAGPSAEWKRQLTCVAHGASEREPLLYPQLGASPTGLTRALVKLARAVRRGVEPAALEFLLEHAMHLIWQAQGEIDALSSRCSGRSKTRQRQNLLRLLRVRNRILMNPSSRFDLQALAAMANYSPWHFVRTFGQVFGEAPCQFGLRTRLAHARKLIGNSRLSITEVAGAVGYDSRSAFARSFRHAHGMSASESRAGIHISDV